MLLEFDDGVGNATVKIWDNWKTVVPDRAYGNYIVPLRLKGQLFLLLPAYDYVAWSGEKLTITCWLEPWNETHELPRCRGIPRIRTCYGTPNRYYEGVGDFGCAATSLKGRLGTPYNVTILPNTGHYAIYFDINFSI